jgi:uncharacterized protein (TIGR02147 family)
VNLYLHLEDLLQASDYRRFALRLLELHAQGGRRLGYADIARRAGFSARSFPRDVLLGKKRLSPVSLNPFIRGLGLKGDWAEYFRLLVEKEESSCRARGKPPELLERALSRVRAHLRNVRKLRQLKDPQQVFRYSCVPITYAALGNLEQGATREEIRARSGLRDPDIAKGLSALLEMGVITQQGERFIAQATQADFQGLRDSQVYSHYYRDLLRRASRSAEKEMSRSGVLHFSSAVSVAQADLPRLKDELRSLLLRYVNQAEKSEGDRVVSIACSLF